MRDAFSDLTAVSSAVEHFHSLWPIFKVQALRSIGVLSDPAGHAVASSASVPLAHPHPST